MKDLGIKVEYGKMLSRDFTVQSLKKDGFEVVFLGIGLPEVFLGVQASSLLAKKTSHV